MKLGVRAVWIGGSLQDLVFRRRRSWGKMAWSEVQVLCRGEVSVTEKEGEARWSTLRAVCIGLYQ